MARIAGVDLPANKRAEVGLTYIYGIGRSRANKILGEAGISIDKRIRELTEEEHRDFPGDAEAQVSQGSQPRHGEWHLAMSDRGVSMVQRMLKAEVQKVQQGQDPIGVTFDENAPVIQVKSGNYYS